LHFAKVTGKSLFTFSCGADAQGFVARPPDLDAMAVGEHHDLIELNGTDLRPQPWIGRRELLIDLVGKEP
jgi:hypothetical protein